jgi:hypothetical protein
VEALIAQIEGDEPEDVLLASAPELIERASTGPPAA